MVADELTKALLFLDKMQEQKYTMIQSYYTKHHEKSSFNVHYYEHLKQEYSNISEVINLLSVFSEIPTFSVVFGYLKKAQDLIKDGVYLECVHLIVPLIPNAENREKAYYVDLLGKGKSNGK